ncbi:CBS domain-containing protein CBSX3, mitochondrial-like isoform X1 [Cynara cardunculus var. scolymus]|uniref:CBS domain-containing protein CBSX3, mitochondrial-like isoform X1 n=1 Tax=Cynara cardunculus var. scolymus TaxID=59895 RepID=UPI000D629F25|nr:CBS domain-containing protein CBSX3, mitochondrial-like isoform X1 [Cynara cardunculus var. scolymus]
MVKMQIIARAIKSCQKTFHIPVLQQLQKYTENAKTIEADQKGLENTTVAEVLMTKEDEKVGSWLWCKSDDTVYDAAKQMARNNIGSLVVLKPGDEQMIAGIITERDYMQKVFVKDRSSKYTRVEEIMTEQNKLVTVTSDTNVYQAMRLMSENQIRHVPVVDGRIVGMISIVDVVRAIVDQQSNEVNKLNEFIKGDYY